MTLILSLFITISPYSHGEEHNDLTEAASTIKKAPKPKSFDYLKMFDIARQTLVGRPLVKKFLKDAFEELLIVDENLQAQFGFKEKVKEMSMAQFILLLSYYPELWPTIELYLKKVPAEVDLSDEKQKDLRKQFREELKTFFADNAVVERMAKLNNPTEAVMLETPDDKPGIKEQEIYFNHHVHIKGKTIEAVDLSELWVKALDATEKEYMINAFEFDLVNIAEAAIRAHKRGVKGIIGIDKNMVEGKDAKVSENGIPVSKDIYNMLKKAGVEVVLVDSVGLNHQKFGAFDWTNQDKATVISSSGNLTRSCSGPQGDLTGVDTLNSKDKELGIPNANHTIVVKSALLAAVAHNSLYQTLVMKLKGSQDNAETGTKGYPLLGAFQIKSKEGWVVFTATPGGSIGNPNKDMFARMLWHARDHVATIIAFALSSADVEETLFKVAEYKVQNGKEFMLNAVLDKPFALANWSVALKILALKVNETTRVIEQDKDSRWRKLLGDEGIAKLQKTIFVGPAFYKERAVKLKNGETKNSGAKIHHKVMQVGPYSTVGSSFNASNAATSNQEVVMVWKSKYFADHVLGALEGLKRHTRTTVARMAEIKNGYLKEFVEAVPKQKTESQQQQANAGACLDKVKKVSGF